jgi:hypothetical protein
MNEHPIPQQSALRRQLARREREIQESASKLEKQEDRLRLLILTLAVDRGIFAVSTSGGSDWQLLTREQYTLRRSRTLKEKESLRSPDPPDPLAA